MNLDFDKPEVNNRVDEQYLYKVQAKIIIFAR